MKIERTDLGYVRGALILLVIALLIAVAAVAGSFLALQSAEKKYQISLTERSEISGKLARASQEEVELREKIGHYQTLTDKGYFGAERRLDWIELMATIRAERHLPDLHYELSPQHSLNKTLLPSGAQAGGYDFMTSTLRLTTNLLHEGDLINLLGDIRARIPAYVMLRGCTMSRAVPGIRNADTAPSLKAECELEWVTIRSQT